MYNNSRVCQNTFIIITAAASSTIMKLGQTIPVIIIIIIIIIGSYIAVFIPFVINSSIPHSLMYTYNVTVEPLYCGHHWDLPKCPDWRGVLITEIVLYTEVKFGTPEVS